MSAEDVILELDNHISHHRALGILDGDRQLLLANSQRCECSEVLVLCVPVAGDCVSDLGKEHVLLIYEQR